MTRTWKNYRVLVLSDAHAGGGGEADDFRQHSKLFETLLRKALDSRVCLVFPGDIIELWQFRIDEILRQYGAIFRMAGRLAEEGRLHFCHGNHDEEAAAIAELLGLGWTSAAVVVETGPGRWWIEHGHRYDPHNRQPSWAHRLLLAGAKVLEKINPNADVLDRYKPASARKAAPIETDPLAVNAQRLLTLGSLSGVVMGHTHRGGIWEVHTPRGPRPYGNCGAWTESCTPGCIVLEGGDMRYVEIHPKAPPWGALFG